jgi:pimeloyl-ACP methyl ester carboxylesterase
MAGYDLELLGPSIECPVLLLQADARLGSATTDDEVARALAILPRASHKRFPGLSHLLFIEDKAAVLQAVEEFLVAVEEGSDLRARDRVSVGGSHVRRQ